MAGEFQATLSDGMSLTVIIIYVSKDEVHLTLNGRAAKPMPRQQVIPSMRHWKEEWAHHDNDKDTDTYESMLADLAVFDRFIDDARAFLMSQQ